MMEEDQKLAQKLAQLTARVHHLKNENEEIQEENKKFEHHLSQSQISLIRSQNQTLKELTSIHGKNRIMFISSSPIAYMSVICMIADLHNCTDHWLTKTLEE